MQVCLFCKSCKCLIINVLRLIIVILFFIAFLNITYVARHTHATMMLTLGADLYTVSKLLGHKNIATTQIYAKIVDKKKEEAIGLIPNLTD